MPKTLELVIKTSKLCNLRCEYCYEFPLLGNREKMSPENIGSFFEKIAIYARQKLEKDTIVRFIWHGGEPFLLGVKYWQRIFDIQEATLKNETFQYVNSMQTNATIMNTGFIDLIKHRDIKLGVSFDVINGLRKFKGGRRSADIVLRSMSELRAANIDFSGIAVLTKHGLGHENEIYNFFNSANIPFRILPLFYDGYGRNYGAGYDLSMTEIIHSLKQFADIYLTTKGVNILPITTWVDIIKRHNLDANKYYYNRRHNPVIFMINTNGDVYTYDDDYGNPDESIGNIFESSMITIVESSAFQQRCLNSEIRTVKNCLDCQFFGHCDGYPVAESNRNARDKDKYGAKCTLDRIMLNFLASRTDICAAADKTDKTAFEFA